MIWRRGLCYIPPKGLQVKFNQIGILQLSFLYGVTPNDYADMGIDGIINFIPNGYWKYEVYEVSWQTGWTVTIDTRHAPKNEDNEFADERAASNYGVVQTAWSV